MSAPWTRAKVIVRDVYDPETIATWLAAAKTKQVNIKQQPIFYPGSGVVLRTVHDVRAWDGRTIGTVKVGYGARMVVQRAGDRWDILSGVSVADTNGRAV